MSNEAKPRELVLPPFTYILMQDVTKGNIRVVAGPQTVNQTQQEVPVIYEHKRGFRRAESLEAALCTNATAVEGWYLELLNPATDGKQPEAGTTKSSAELAIGRRVNMHGPVNFPLWPGQKAQARRGHHLRPNQYLLGRVYNSEEARKHWDDAIVNTTASDVPSDGKAAKRRNPLPLPADLVEGLTFVIKGTEVAFYMPPTGVVVESEANTEGECTYVRDALTLERLEYCILVSDNGSKRYEQGPRVVFPLPDERFITVRDDKGKVSRKFQAIELNDIQGIHIKVSAPYTDDAGKMHTAGEELFITGKDMPIFFPREQHSIVKYDGQTKHFAVAVPAGEARYVMNRQTGEIRMVKGPAMLLPNPVFEVIVRRALTDRECELMYPGNVEVKEYNQSLRDLADKAPTTRAGVVSDNEAMRNSAKLDRRTLGGNEKGASRNASAIPQGMTVSYAASTYNESALAGAMIETSHVGRDQMVAGDEFSRAASFTQPRTITLVNKFQGVPQISPWTGYAVLVVDPNGTRRVVEGPERVLLAYDETLEALELSSGKPKTTDRLYRTAYLRTSGNRVTDIFAIETLDHVSVEVKLEYSVQFEGDDKTKWFKEANYVKLLCDHVRSLLKGTGQGLGIEDFYRRATEIIRDTILGKKTVGSTDPRPGLFFASNAMRVVDVNVLETTIKDPRVKKLMDDTQYSAVASLLQVSGRETELATTRKTAEIDLAIERIRAHAAAEQAALVIEAKQLKVRVLESELLVVLTGHANRLRELGEQTKVEADSQKLVTLAHDAGMERDKRAADQRLVQAEREMTLRISEMQAEAQAMIAKMSTIAGPLAGAMESLSRNDVLEKMAKAWSFQTMVGGQTVADALSKVFENTPLAAYVQNMITKIPGNGRSAIDVVQPRT